MSMSLEEALAAALDDEYRARATYRAVLDAFGDVRPFSNIIESEERHIAALIRLYERYEITPPPDAWAGRVSAPPSLRDACQTGVDAERENAGLYDRLIEAARDHPDVVETFRRLRAASQENHLPAFERGLRRESRDGEPGSCAGGGRGGGGGGGRRRRHRGGHGG